MSSFPTLVVRHCKERLSKCTLRGLETHPSLRFYTFRDNEILVPREEAFPETDGFIYLTMDAPPLGSSDRDRGLLVLDGTWKLARHMELCLGRRLEAMIPRSLPSGIRTAYPRTQTACPDPERGLATVEALYVAHSLLGRETDGLLGHYHWREKFLELNAGLEIC